MLFFKIRRFIASLLLSLLVLLAAGSVYAASADKDKKLVEEVFNRLLAVVDAPENMEWPPTVEVVDSEQVNAYAMVDQSGDSNQPKVVVFGGMVKRVIQGDDDRLAFILGHELAHITLGHCTQRRISSDTPLMKATFTREQEYEADLQGMTYAVAAGYSKPRAIKGIKRIMDLGFEYSSFEGLGVDHPSWKDRLVYLDSKNAEIWKAMSAFENGSLFLLIEQYRAAEVCFKKVTDDFEECYEAWANLGYARLMQYCDNLDQKDLAQFDIGHVVCGGFYRRPASIESTVRGIDEDLWWDAVDALRQALRIKPDSALAKANLGLAYLLRPAGKDIAQANRWLDEAVDAAENDKSIDPIAKAVVYINAGVGEMAEGDIPNCTARLDKAEEYAHALQGSTRSSFSTSAVENAILYNRALLLANKDAAKAVGLLERYLRNTSPSSAWWSYAYRQYAQACAKSGKPAKSENTCAAECINRWRMFTSVVVGGVPVVLAGMVNEVTELLGDYNIVPVASNTNLSRLCYEEYGVELLVSGQIIAICLTDENAPELPLSSVGLGGDNAASLRVGMSKEELEKLLGDEDYDFRQLDNADINYRYYRDLGLAVRVKGGKVIELAVVQIPERRMPV